MTLGSELKDAATVYGEFKIIIGVIIGIIISLILLIVGIRALTAKQKMTASAVITDVTKCTNYENDAGQMYECVVDVSYTVGQTKYQLSGVVLRDSAPAIAGETRQVMFSPATPQSATLMGDGMLQKVSQKTFGMLLIGAGVLVGVISGIVGYFGAKSKSFDAAYGTVSILSKF